MLRCALGVFRFALRGLILLSPAANTPYLCGTQYLATYCVAALLARLQFNCGGEGGIRTPETLAGLPAFQAGALGHYATSPFFEKRAHCTSVSPLKKAESQ